MKAIAATFIMLFGLNSMAMRLNAEVSCKKRYNDRTIEVVHVKNAVTSEEIYIIQHSDIDNSSVVIFQDDVVSYKNVITGKESRLVLLENSKGTLTIKAKHYEDLDGALLKCEKDIETSFDI